MHHRSSEPGGLLRPLECKHVLWHIRGVVGCEGRVRPERRGSVIRSYAAQSMRLGVARYFAGCRGTLLRSTQIPADCRPKMLQQGTGRRRKSRSSLFVEFKVYMPEQVQLRFCTRSGHVEHSFFLVQSAFLFEPREESFVRIFFLTALFNGSKHRAAREAGMFGPAQKRPV